jgi:hypothetical protein
MTLGHRRSRIGARDALGRDLTPTLIAIAPLAFAYAGWRAALVAVLAFATAHAGGNGERAR